MNAILVFDPSNDLVFVKSNKLFKTRVLRYSKLQGLIASAANPLTPDPASCTSTTTTSSSSSSPTSSQSSSPCSEMSTQAGRGTKKNVFKRQRRFSRAPFNNEHLLNASNGQLDTNKKYLEILMLLLTPYVASLRLSDLVRQQQRAAHKSLSPSSSAAAAASSSQRKSSNGDLLSKFMSSIQVNHETMIDDADTATRNRKYVRLSEDDDDDNDGNDSGKAHHEFTPRRFSQFQMPVECLSDCQIVYCELFDFIFIHMQQLEQVSSFKMRLLQKRIDLFARLALLLFGPSLNSMRNSPNTNGNGGPQQVDQGRILRQVYDVWLEHQFEPQFLLEANEKLMVGESIEQHCRDTLRKLSIHLRRCSAQGETHMHALLYSGTKLVSQFSCRNSQSLNDDDLILILLLLKTYNIHHNNELTDDDDDDANDDVKSGRRPPMAPSSTLTPTYCYNSNFNTNRRTSEIYPTPPGSSPPSLSMGISSVKSGFRQRHRHQLRQSRASCSPSESQMSSGSPSVHTGDYKLPSQFLIFLSTPGKFKDRLRVPHMLCLVPLARGVTLIIISEISTSYLSLQLNRVLKILLELTDPVASAGEAATGPSMPQLAPQPPAITKTPVVSPRRAPATASLSNLQEQEQRQSSSGCLVKLSQLAKINDCVCAIKSYFNGQNYDLVDHHQHSVVGGQPLGLNSPTRARRQLSRGAPNQGWPAASRSTSEAGDCATGARQQRRQFNLVNLFSRWYSGSGGGSSSSESDTVDQTQAKSKRHAGIETSESSEPDFESNSGGSSPAAKTVYESLDEHGRRQCCQLVCRLEDLVSSNMHTYMRRTFNLPVEERKRQALLNTVSLVLRESQDTFVFQPQMRLLNDPRGPYLRLQSELLDQVRLLAGEHLSDYLDYLAVKATCNVTLGAPLTDDMPALRSFIYVDRGRQEMLVSPMTRNLSKMDRDSMFEIDFRSAISTSSTLSHNLRSSKGLSSESSSESESCSEQNSEADESSSASSSDSIESVIYRPSLNAGGVGRAYLSTPIKAQQPVASKKLENVNRRAKSQWLIGTSDDLVPTNEYGGSSSGHSSSLTNITSSSQNNIGSQHYQNRRTEGRFDQCNNRDNLDDMTLSASSPSVHLVDETLVKGFTCFIYNRLAKGKTSFTSNDGTYVYSYFLWFKHSNKVVELDHSRKQAIARNLEANYKSMPSVVCGDFFNNYARIILGDKLSGKSLDDKIKRPHKLVEVACQISELDALSGNRLVRRRLTQLKDMEEENNEDMNTDETDDLLSESDFGLFLRNQTAPKTTRSPRFTIARLTGSEKARTGAKTSDKVKVKRAAAGNGPLQCYELFCIHQASLLVHRRQVLVEAERLARRLAQLCSGD